MISLTFSRAYPYKKNSISVPVRLEGVAGSYMVMAVLDTGATHSVFSKAHASVIGIQDLTSGTPISLTKADGVRDQAYIHQVPVECFGKRFTSEIAFCPSWPDDIANLLGMRGFFNHFRIAFEHKVRKLYI